MSNPGLTPQWANIILDSHQKNFADECAICFSEIKHSFSPADLAVKADGVEDDVASCGTDESDDYGVTGAGSGAGRIATFVGRPCKDERAGGVCAGAPEEDRGRGLSGPLLDGASSAPESFGPTTPCAGDGDGSDLPPAPLGGGGDFDAYDAALGGAVIAEEPAAREAGDAGETVIALDGRHPDMIAEDIMTQPAQHSTKEQLELLYKTCRCGAAAATSRPFP
jgi:hypothetical protein